MQTTKNQNMTGTKIQTSELKISKCPIFPDLALFSGETGLKMDVNNLVVIEQVPNQKTLF